MRCFGLTLAAVIAAAMPTFVLFSVVVLSETPFALAMLVNLWAFAVFVRNSLAGSSIRSTLGWAFASGL